MKKVIVLLVFTTCYIFVSSQGNYFVKDTMVYYGADIKDKGAIINARFCTFMEYGIEQSFTPYEVKQYSLRDGTVYISREIPTSDGLKAYFLERVIEGRTTLYVFADTKTRNIFFLEDVNGNLIEIKNDDIRGSKPFVEQLRQLSSDCPAVSESVNFLRYRKSYLTEFVKRYNRCDTRTFPFFRVGVVSGFEMMKLNPSAEFINMNLSMLDYEYNGSFSLGLFATQPLFFSGVHIYAEMMLSKHGFSINKIVNSYDVDYVLNISSLKIPIMLKYQLPYGKIRPFISAGGLMTWHHKNSNEIYEWIMSGNSVTYSDPSFTSYLDDYQYGVVFGAGVEANLSSRKRLFFEGRYFVLSGDFVSMGSNIINILVGVSL